MAKRVALVPRTRQLGLAHHLVGDPEGVVAASGRCERMAQEHPNAYGRIAERDHREPHPCAVDEPQRLEQLGHGSLRLAQAPQHRTSGEPPQELEPLRGLGQIRAGRVVEKIVGELLDREEVAAHQQPQVATVDRGVHVRTGFDPQRQLQGALQRLPAAGAREPERVATTVPRRICSASSRPSRSAPAGSRSSRGIARSTRVLGVIEDQLGHGPVHRHQRVADHGSLGIDQISTSQQLGGQVVHVDLGPPGHGRTDRGVQTHPGPCPELGVKRLSDQGMPEVENRDGGADLGDQTGAHRGGQPAVHLVGGQAGRGLEQTELAVPADHRGHVEKPARLDREPTQPMDQDVVDGSGNLAPGARGVVGLAHQSGELAEVERVAGGAVGCRGGGARIGFPAEPVGEQLTSLFVSQPGQPKALRLGCTSQPSQPRAQRRRSVPRPPPGRCTPPSPERPRPARSAP